MANANVKSLLAVVLCLMVVSATLPRAYACDKLRCGAIIGVCGLTCACDYPACECCAECASCMGDLWEECCDCFNLCGDTTARSANATSAIRALKPKTVT